MRPTSRFSAAIYHQLTRQTLTRAQHTSSKLFCMSQYNVLFLVDAHKGANECSAIGDFDTRLEVQV